MLIDPVPLEKQVQDCINQCYKLRIDSVGPLAMFLDYIKEAPRIEANEVIHARWLAQVDNPNELPRYKCSNCEDFVQAGDDRNYCLSCNAKMDGWRE